MAETSVNLVLSKLADVAVKEVLLRYGIDEKVERVNHELLWLQAFIKDVDRKQITDERQKYWLKVIRDIANSVEDAIDTFLIEIPQNPPKSGKRETIKNILRKTKKLPAVHHLVNEMNQIQEKMKEIVESRIRYGSNNLGESSGDIRLPIEPPVLPDIDPDIVGFQEEHDHIVKELLDETTTRRSVVSICGIGGLGKTTLAQKVYNCNDVKRQFGVRIWVPISKWFEVIDVLMKIGEQLEFQQLPKEIEVILTTIHKSLRGKKYLIVLDDVWTIDLWTQICAAFPEENNGSRVLVTTRLAHVPMGMDSISEPHKLKYLTKELSRELLLKTVFPNHDPTRSSFDDLSDILDQFVHKCGGLPLALVVLGRLLSKKPCNYAAWSRVLQTMSWHVEGKDGFDIIGTSHEDLPFSLKLCFMYFAAFPKGYNINATSLLRMWIAEGFIPQEDNRTLEETAESFLENLVQRSMVQVNSRSFDGSIEIIRIHDLMQELAIQKAKEENFLLVYSQPDENMSLSRARRVAIHNPNCDNLIMSQNLRTLLCFFDGRMPNCSKQRLLRVVSFEQNWENKIELGMFEGLTQLRYLCLAGIQSDKDDQKFFEKVIGTMKFLQTLNVQLVKSNNGDELFEFPKCAWNIKTLRHVNYDSNTFEIPASTKLTNLQTIAIVMAIHQSWGIELPHIPNLRSLQLDAESCPPAVIVAFLSTLQHLTNLIIWHDHSIPDILDMRSFPFYGNLQSLKLDYNGSTKFTLHESMLPCNLIYLNIDGDMFEQDIMPVLEKLQRLKVIYLCAVSESREMRCSSRGFSQLEVMKLGDLSIEEWEIEKGAMPILRELVISDCDELGVPRGLQYLTRLKKLTWAAACLHPTSKADIIHNLCKHVPSISLGNSE